MAIRMVVPCKYCGERLPFVATMRSSDPGPDADPLTATYTFDVIDSREAEQHMRRRHPEVDLKADDQTPSRGAR